MFNSSRLQPPPLWAALLLGGALMTFSRLPAGVISSSSWIRAHSSRGDLVHGLHHEISGTHHLTAVVGFITHQLLDGGHQKLKGESKGKMDLWVGHRAYCSAEGVRTRYVELHLWSCTAGLKTCSQSFLKHRCDINTYWIKKWHMKKLSFKLSHPLVYYQGQ